MLIASSSAGVAYVVMTTDAVGVIDERGGTR